MRLRIAAALATGVIIIGISAWPLAAPPEPLGVVSLINGNISFGDAIALLGLALLAGFIAYFLSWPHGRQIAILAVPAGLAVWAVRSGTMAGLLQINPTLTQRQTLFATLKWEPVFWLAVIAAGFAGVLLGQKIHPNLKTDKSHQKPDSKSNIYLNPILATLISGLIAQFCIGIFAQDVKIFNGKLGVVVAQPAVGQIVFAVLFSFGIAAFVVKKFLNADYIWPIAASALITGFAVTTHLRQDILQHLCQRWPAVFFSNAIIPILPVQIVAFGALGSITGYWLAIRYNYWRKYA